MSALLARRRQAEPVALHCAEHDVDLAAMRRFVADGRPSGTQAAVRAIAGGACPACIPRYTAGWWGVEDGAGEAAAGTGGSAERWVDPLALLPRPWPRPGGPLACDCCASIWDLAPEGWVAEPGAGLCAVVPATRRSPRRWRAIGPGRIDSLGHRVEPIDVHDCAGEALWLEFAAFDGLSERIERDDLVEDVTESVVAAFSGGADGRAELARIAAEHGLDADLAAAWRRTALDALAVLHAVAALWPGDGGAPGVRAMTAEATVARRGGAPGAAAVGDPSGVVPDADAFERLVASVLDDLPGLLSSQLPYMPVVCEDEPPGGLAGRGERFACFEGSSREGHRGEPAGANRLLLYRGPICRSCGDDDEVRDVVRQIVAAALARRLGARRVRERR